jgi:hypothetical protein
VPRDFAGACRPVLVNDLKDSLDKIRIGLGKASDSSPRPDKVARAFHPPAEEWEKL